MRLMSTILVYKFFAQRSRDGSNPVSLTNQQGCASRPSSRTPTTGSSWTHRSQLTVTHSLYSNSHGRSAISFTAKYCLISRRLASKACWIVWHLIWPSRQARASLSEAMTKDTSMEKKTRGKNTCKCEREMWSVLFAVRREHSPKTRSKSTQISYLRVARPSLKPSNYSCDAAAL